MYDVIYILYIKQILVLVVFNIYGVKINYFKFVFKFI